MVSKAGPANIPADFPRGAILGSVGGAMPKVLAVRTEEGKYVSPTLSEDEVLTRWKNCEDLAGQFAQAAMRSKTGKRSDWREEDILAQYLPRLKAKGWLSDAESVWTLRRSAAMLNWPVPECLQ